MKNALLQRVLALRKQREEAKETKRFKEALEKNLHKLGTPKQQAEEKETK